MKDIPRFAEMLEAYKKRFPDKVRRSAIPVDVDDLLELIRAAQAASTNR